MLRPALPLLALVLLLTPGCNRDAAPESAPKTGPEGEAPTGEKPEAKPAKDGQADQDAARRVVGAMTRLVKTSGDGLVAFTQPLGDTSLDCETAVAKANAALEAVELGTRQEARRVTLLAAQVSDETLKAAADELEPPAPPTGVAETLAGFRARCPDHAGPLAHRTSRAVRHLAPNLILSPKGVFEDGGFDRVSFGDTLPIVEQLYGATRKSDDGALAMRARLGPLDMVSRFQFDRQGKLFRIDHVYVGTGDDGAATEETFGTAEQALTQLFGQPITKRQRPPDAKPGFSALSRVWRSSRFDVELVFVGPKGKELLAAGYIPAGTSTLAAAAKQPTPVPRDAPEPKDAPQPK